MPSHIHERVRRLEKAPPLLTATTLLAVAAALLVARVKQDIPPFEDAAILMRYSLDLAHGHGIVWNPGEKPVDSAIDFLFMVTVAAIVRLGVPLELATRGLIAASHLALVDAMYLFAPAIGVRTRSARLAVPLYVAAGPAALLTSSHFGAPFFALLVGLSALLAFNLAEGFSMPKAVAFSSAVALTAQARPEGLAIGVSL